MLYVDLFHFFAFQLQKTNERTRTDIDPTIRNPEFGQKYREIPKNSRFFPKSNKTAARKSHRTTDSITIVGPRQHWGTGFHNK